MKKNNSVKNVNTQNNNFKFDVPYNKQKWAEHFGENFKEEYGSVAGEDEIIEKNKDFLNKIIWIGDLNINENEVIGVFEVYIKNTRLASRVKISRICSRILMSGSYGKGIFFILYEDNKNNYRVSYVKHDKTGIKGEDGLIIMKDDYSNPKRYTFLLGEGIKVHTPASRITSDIFGSVESIENAFSVEGVNKEFYKGVKEYFEKIHNDIIKYFDKDENKAKEFALRFLGRVLFCWFLREKELIPNEILNSGVFENLKYKKNYYSDVLEDLFFNVLNMDMEKRKFSKERVIYNYEKAIPFLNGGLFSKKEDDEAVESIDDEIIKGLFEFFEMYNFTVDESAPFDVEISIDPEMLGRIFENLLIAIDPNEEFDIGNSTFYTPREIVDYMIVESIKLYLIKNSIDVNTVNQIFESNNEINIDEKEKEKILKCIHNIKLLDPACGSGAFPIGFLQRIFIIIDKLDSKHEYYKKYILENIKGLAKKEFEKLYKHEKFNYIYKLNILQTMIHGIDIQPIATEISRLRAFLSLIVEENKNVNEDNLGIKPLPNLEFNFITSNSLIPLEIKKLEQKSFESMYTEGIIEKIKKISEDYFNAFSEEEKQNVKNRFNELTEFILNNDFLDKKDKKLFTSWNPFTNQQANFFNSKIQFGIKDKFDIIIANPPYYRFNNKEHSDNIKYFKKSELYKPACMGKINAYELFLLLSYKECKENGIICEIFQNSFLTDKASKGVRKFYIDNTSIYKMLSFPERDDKKKRIFENAKMSVMILEAIKEISDKNNFILEVYSDKMKTLSKKANINSKLIETIDKENMEIPNLTDKELPILVKCYKNIRKLSDIVDIYEGELNVSLAKKYFTDSKKEPFLVGANIQKYYIRKKPSQRTVPEYYDRKKYLSENKAEKSYHYKLERIAFQGITGVNDKYRIIATIVPPNYGLANSANYMLIKENVKDISYNLLLGLLNSSIINWIFNSRSTNSNVNNYEIERLPIPRFTDKDKNTIEELVIECMQLKENDETADIKLIQKDIDKIIYKLYNISDEEIKIIEGII